MLKIRKGDSVLIQLGKDRGKTGSVERVLTKNKKVVIKGLNMYKRHIRKMQGIEGGIIELAKPMDLSNIALVCPNCKKPTRVAFKVESESKVRVCKKCGKEIGGK